MGLPLPDHVEQPHRPSHTPNLQKYYSQTYRQYVTNNQNLTFSSRSTVANIFTRTNNFTDTFSNRDLAILDIDKLLSFNTGSLHPNDHRVSQMQMVAQLMEDQRRNHQVPNNTNPLNLFDQNYSDNILRMMMLVDEERQRPRGWHQLRLQ